MHSARINMSYFLYPAQLHIGTPAVLDKEEAAHLLLSRRVKVGEKIEVQDVLPHRFICTITALSKKAVTITPIHQIALPTEPKRVVHIYQAYTAEQTIHTIIQKLTELGVASLTIFSAKHSPTRPVTDKLPRWQRISMEAAKQSGRPHPIKIELHTYTDLLPTATQATRHIFLSQHSTTPLATLLAKSDTTPLHLWVGPEGGWASEEIGQFTDAGMHAAHMGTYTLRAETAAITSAGIALHI